jgi:hypothetical protein
MTIPYDVLTGRHRGLISPAEQRALAAGAVFVCGTGGMGGVAAQLLVRAGLGRIAIADHDVFEGSNANRQVYADAHTLGEPKATVTADRLRAIRGDLAVQPYGAAWTAQLDDILRAYPVVINAMDDLAAGLHLYRRADALGATVIDAYTSPLPSLTVVAPHAPRPEARLGFPTLGTAWDAITPAQRDACRLAEFTHVLVHSSSADHVDHAVIAEVFAGRQSRPSWGPMVWTTAALMAGAALDVVMGRRPGADHVGWFFNPARGRVEHPRAWPVAAVRRRVVVRQLAALTSGAHDV